MTSQDLVSNYATAFLAVSSAEGDVDLVRAELRGFVSVLEDNDDLRTALSDKNMPVANRNQVIDDLLTGKVSDVSRGLIALVISSGHVYQMSEIVNAFVDKAVTQSGSQFATVRSAVALSEDQRSRLAKTLSASLGKDVEIENVVDPDLVGGIVTTIGDKVIDGSVRTKLDKMRETL